MKLIQNKKEFIYRNVESDSIQRFRISKGVLGWKILGQNNSEVVELHHPVTEEDEEGTVISFIPFEESKWQSYVIDEELPDACYYKDKVSGSTVIIKKGQPGYYIARHDYQGLDIDKLNDEIGVSKAQAEAMHAGSLFGWHVPGADPSRYDSNGRFKKEELK